MNHNITRTLLVIEDNPGDARLLREMLDDQSSGHREILYVGTMGEAESHLSERLFDTILLDLGLPDAHGLAAIQRARAAAPDTPLVVLTGLDDEELATLSLQQGVQDYLIKGQIESRGLLRALRYAAERKRLERLKNEFVATVSHELRTPLTSISASLGLLMGKAGGFLPPPVLRLLKIAHSNSQRLVRLVNDVLDIEKLESGQVVFDLRRIDVGQLVEQATAANSGLAEEHGVHLRIEGSKSGIAYVRADADRLAQVLTNLVSNAVKFSPPGSEVVITVAQEPEFVRISVRDYGSGIAPDFKSRIFERFAQADATNSRRKGGTGLGLSIVKQIVERLGGKVGFFDAAGCGTVFYIDLPSWEGKANLAFIDPDAAIFAESGASLDALLAAARDRLITPACGVELQTVGATDGQTEISNRQHFETLGHLEWARFQRYGRPLTLLLLDIDGLGLINDRIGHDAEDQVFEKVAALCKLCSRATDTVARVGPGEFAILLPETDEDAATVLAERLRHAVHNGSDPLRAGNEPVSVSIGIAVATPSMATFDALFKHAELALFAAKEASRNTVLRAPIEALKVYQTAAE